MISVPVLTTVVNGISSFFTKKQEIKKASVTAKAKLETLKTTGEQALELTDAEWEALSVQTQQSTWKDEYVTIVITSPFITILLGSVAAALGQEWGVKIVDGTVKAIESMTSLGMDYGLILNAVVFAAIGLKVWRA